MEELDINNVIYRYTNGETIPSIAKDYGKHYTTIKRILVKAEVPIRDDRSSHKDSVVDINEKDIPGWAIFMLSCALTNNEICDLLGISPVLLRRKLRYFSEKYLEKLRKVSITKYDLGDEVEGRFTLDEVRYIQRSTLKMAVDKGFLQRARANLTLDDIVDRLDLSIDPQIPERIWITKDQVVNVI